jgi:hypothetical protein
MNWLSLSIVAAIFAMLVLIFIQIKKRRRSAAELRHEIGLDDAQVDHDRPGHSRDEAVWRRSYSR